MVSAAIIFRRFVKALRHAVREEEFLPILASGGTLILIGTITYAVAEGWSVIDALYFSVATLTTSTVADSKLELTHAGTKLFTVFFVLLGIGILVETARRLGMAFVEVQREERQRLHRSGD